MSIVTRASLQTSADTVRNETTQGANSAARIGGLFRDIADSCLLDDTGEDSYFADRNALLEPSALELMQFDTFTYAPGSARYVLASFATSLNGSSGRFEVRNPANPLLLDSASSLVGLQSGASAIILNPASAPSYASAKSEYYRKLALLRTLPLKFLALPTQNATYPFICGPYGTLMVRVVKFDLTWIAGQNFRSDIGFNFGNELGDVGTTDYERNDNALQMILAKSQIGSLQTGLERTTGVGSGGVAFYLLPSTWSAAADPVSGTYVFRDDLMSGSLSNWALTQSAGGNISLNTKFAAVSGIGTNAWGTNGMISTATYSRSAGLRFVADVWVNGTAASQTIFGLSDGGGVSYTNFLHGFSVSDSGMSTFESSGITSLGANSRSCMFRVRITPGATKGALYELQGGSTNPAIGSSTWTTVNDTRVSGTVNSATFKIGYTPYNSGISSYISDVRVY